MAVTWGKRVGLWLVVSLLFAAQPVQARPLSQERIPIQYGQTVSGTINEARFFQQYNFSGRRGEVVEVIMEAVSGNLDPLLLIGDSQLNLIGEDDDGAGGFNARLELVLPADGDYIIEATRYGQDGEAGQSQGDYRLTLLGSSGNGDSRRGMLVPLDYGDTVRGRLSGQDCFHLFWFQAQAGSEIRVQAMLSLDLRAVLLLYDSTFGELVSDSSGREILFTVPADGVYFAALGLSDLNQEGAYAVALSGTASTVNETLSLPITPGERVEGQLSDTTWEERYTFAGQVNGQVLLQLRTLEGTLDPFLYLYGPNGEIIGQDDDSGGMGNAELAAVLPLEGQYTVVATRFGRQNGSSAGRYELLLYAGAGEQAGAVAPITRPKPQDFAGLPELQYGQAVQGQIGADYYAAYVFEARAGDQITITMERLSGDLDSMIVLLDESLQTVAQQDDISDENKNARLEYVVPSAGYYAILATRYESETGTTSGDYALTLTAGNTPAALQVTSLLAATPLVPDSTHEQRLEKVANIYSLAASAGDVVRVSLSSGAIVADDVMLILTDGDLQEVAFSRSGELSYRSITGGTYLLFVVRQRGPFTLGSGLISLDLTGATGELPASCAGLGGERYAPESVLPYGAVVVDSLSNETPELAYYFDAQVGDRISIQMNAVDATLDPEVIILDPDGVQAVRDNDSGGNLNSLVAAYLVRAEGRYTVIAGRRGASQGHFELVLNGTAVTRPDPGSGQTGQSVHTAIPLAAGQTYAGAIGGSAVAVFYAFEGAAGQTLDISMVRMNGDLDAFVAVLDANQNLVAMDDDGGGNQNSRVVYTLASNGQYYILATRYDFAAGVTSGDYLLSLVVR